MMGCSAQRADYKSMLKQIDSSNQAQLDNGKDMLETERAYLIKLHRFMDVIYDDLIENEKNNVGNLQSEQAIWRKEYEIKAAKIWESMIESENRESFIGNDLKMMAYGEQADLVHKRILELIDKF
jgi:hypothetical protein